MSEWKERLHALDDLGPDDDVYRRALEGPRRGESPDGPSGPNRLAAGIVAFAVFAAAAIFGWQALRPNDRPEPVGPRASPAVITLEGTDEGPTATLSFDGAEQAGVFEGHSWCSTPDDCTSVTRDLGYPPLDDAVEVPAGRPIRFEGDGIVERFVVRTTEGDRSSPNVVVDTDGRDSSVPDQPGEYLIWVAADWEQGSGSFYLRVRAVPSPDSPGAAERAVGDIYRVDVAAFPNAVVAEAGSVWVSGPFNGSEDDDGTGAGEVVRIDPASGEVLARIAVRGMPTWEFGGGGITAGDGQVWIAGSTFGQGRSTEVLAQRIDPNVDRVVQELSAGAGSAADIWVDGADLWLLMFTPGHEAMELVRFDVTTGEETGRLALPVRWSQEVFVAAGSAWIVGDDRSGGPISPDTLYRIDPASMTVAGREQLDEAFEAFVSGGVIWVPTPDGFGQLDPATLEVTQVNVEIPSACCIGSLLPDDAGGFWYAGNRGRAHDLLHFDRQGVLRDVVKGAPYEGKEPWTGIASTYDPGSDSFWFVQYRDEVLGVRLQP